MRDEYTKHSVGDVLTYLRQNYMTAEEVASRAGIAVDRLNELVQAQCVPPHSHSAQLCLTTETSISGQKETVDSEVRYYHPDTVRYIRVAERFSLSGHSLAEISALTKERFLREAAQALGQPLVEIEKLAEEGWEEFMSGTYGVCLKRVSAQSMVKKQHAVHRLQKLLDQHGSKATPELIDGLRSALQDYNEVAAAFGPHEILDSSRGKFAKKAEKILSKALSDTEVNAPQGQGAL